MRTAADLIRCLPLSGGSYGTPGRTGKRGAWGRRVAGPPPERRDRGGAPARRCLRHAGCALELVPVGTAYSRVALVPFAVAWLDRGGVLGDLVDVVRQPG